MVIETRIDTLDSDCRDIVSIKKCWYSVKNGATKE